MTLSRRRFLTGTGSLAAAAVLSGCAGFTKSGDSGSEGGGGSQAGTLKFTTWGSDAEAAAFNAVLERFFRMPFVKKDRIGDTMKSLEKLRSR